MERRRVRPALALALATLATLASFVVRPDVASAHSVLESTSPAAGETVASSPTTLTLTFNEPVSVAPGALRLLDVDGHTVPIGTPRSVDATVTVPLTDDLADGSYVVAWKVMSADSHPVSGAFTFAVGAPSVSSTGADTLAAAQAAGSTGAGAQAAVDLAAVLAYGGVLLAVGAALFSAFVTDDAPPGVGLLVRWSAAVGAVGLLGGVVASAASIDGSWPSGRTFVDELTGAPGIQAAVALSGLGLVLVVVAKRSAFGATVAKVVTIDGALAALGAFVIVGHTRTASPIALTIAVDIVHLAAAAVWSGGLVALLLTLRADAATASVAAVVARFSSVAAVSLVGVVAAGAVLGWRIVGSWGALTGTTYGVLLLVKVGLVAVLAAVGGYNRFRLVDRVATDGGGGGDGSGSVVLRRTLGVEVALVVAIVGVTGSFTSISPEPTPAQPATTPLSCAAVQAMEGQPGMETMDHTCVGTTTTLVPFDPTQSTPAPASGGPVTASAAFGDGLAVVKVDPAKVGSTTVTISLTDATGTPLVPRDPPTVQFRLRAKELGPITQTAEATGTGTYRVTQDLVLPGTWEINVSAVVSDFEQPQAVVKVDIGS